MIVIKVMERDMIVTTTSRITSGSVNLPVKFHFKGDEWDDLVKTAVFIGSGEERDVALITDECAVPADVLTEAGGDLKIGVYGRLANGATVIPTIWGRVQYIYEGTEMGEPSPHSPEPDWTAQVQQAAATALTKAQAVEEAAARGDFDGVSPEVTIDTIAHGHSVTITDEEHPEGQSFPVLDGASAYEQAVAGGYTGTEAQFNQELQSFKTLSEQAKEAAPFYAEYGVTTKEEIQAAINNKRQIYLRHGEITESVAPYTGTFIYADIWGEGTGYGFALTNGNWQYVYELKSEWTYSIYDLTAPARRAETAAAGVEQHAQEAAASAADAAAAAAAAIGSVSAAAGSAQQAGASATAAADSATAAEEHEYDAEAWADGERKGSPVGSTDKTYHNNAKYYAQQAGASATAAGQSVDAAAESATAAAASATAAAGSASAAETAKTQAEAAKTATETARDTAVSTLQTEGAAQRTAIQQKGAEVLESIPSDYTDLSDDVDDLKSALIEYNAIGFFVVSANKENSSSAGINFVWDGDTCKATGTATNIALKIVYDNPSGLPTGLKPGESYRVICSASAPNNYYCNVRYYNGGNSSIYLADFKKDGVLTIPENATGLAVRYRVNSGATVNNDTLNFDILTTYTNKELSENISTINKSVTNLSKTKINKRTEVLADYFGTWDVSTDSAPDGSLSIKDDMPTNTRKFLNTIKVATSDVPPCNGNLYIEKNSSGGFSYYRAIPNIDGRECLGFLRSGAFEWYVKGSRRPLKIAMFGDSITKGIIGGGTGSEVTPRTIPYYVALQTGQLVSNFAVGSMGYISKANLDTTAEEYIPTIDLTGYDVVTLAYGMNDSAANLGTYEDTTEQTIMGAIYRIVSGIMTNYPNMRIILISPTLSKSTLGTFPGWGYTMMRGNEAPYFNFVQLLEEQRKFGERYYIPVIDGSKCFNSWNVVPLIGDNVHPTVAGYDVIGPYFAGQIAKLL